MGFISGGGYRVAVKGLEFRVGRLVGFRTLTPKLEARPRGALSLTGCTEYSLRTKRPSKEMAPCPYT